MGKTMVAAVAAAGLLASAGAMAPARWARSATLCGDRDTCRSTT